MTPNFLTRSQNHVFNRTDTKIVHVVPQLVVPLTVLSEIAHDFYFFRYAIRSKKNPPCLNAYTRHIVSRQGAATAAVPLIKTSWSWFRPQ